MEIRPPEKSFGPIYEDDRWRDPYAFNIRHRDTLEILRYRKREEALKAQDAFKRQGYSAFKRGSTRSRKVPG